MCPFGYSNLIQYQHVSKSTFQHHTETLRLIQVTSKLRLITVVECVFNYTSTGDKCQFMNNTLCFKSYYSYIFDKEVFEISCLTVGVMDPSLTILCKAVLSLCLSLLTFIYCLTETWFTYSYLLHKLSIQNTFWHVYSRDDTSVGCILSSLRIYLFFFTMDTVL